MRLLITIFLLLPVFLFGQTVTIQGYVVTSSKESLANVRVKVGNSIAVFTDSEGFFSTKIPLKNNLNVRVPVEASKAGYQTYKNEDLILTDGKNRMLDNIILFKEGELSNKAILDSAKEKEKLITSNNKIISINQEMLKKAEDLPVQYRTEIQAILTEIEQLTATTSDIQKRITILDNELKHNANKSVMTDFVAKEQAVLAQQALIIDKQATIFQALSAQMTKANLVLETAKIEKISNDAIQITFRFKDAFGNTLDSSNPQVIGVAVVQLAGGNSQKLLVHQPENGEIGNSPLKRNVDLSQSNSIRFESKGNFTRRRLKQGLMVQFFVDDAFVGSHGYRL